MKDVELSFFFLFLQAVGLQLEQNLFEDGNTTNKSSSWREREQRPASIISRQSIVQ
jgi:hypothetical protein